MKTILLLLPCALIAGAVPAVLADGKDAAAATESAEAGPFAPKQYPAERYAHLDRKSPFEFDPPPEKPADVVNNFDGVSLGGYCGTGKTMTVYLIEGKEKKRVTVYGDGSPYKKRDESGYRIISLNKGKSLSSTTVLLEKGGQQAEVKFEKETLTAKAGGAPAGGQVRMVPGPDGKMVPQPVIPRPGGMTGQPQASYQAPPPFIPGQGAAGGAGNNPGNPQNNNPVLANGLNTAVPQPNGTMTNQQLVNQLVNTPGVAPSVVQPGGAPPQPSRRRVVLPTQQPPPAK